MSAKKTSVRQFVAAYSLWQSLVRDALKRKGVNVGRVPHSLYQELFDAGNSRTEAVAIIKAAMRGRS